MKKPIIGISGSRVLNNVGIFRSYVNENYVNAVLNSGGIPFIIPFSTNDGIITEQIAQVDGLILSGGHDVDPRNYGEESQQKIGDIWPDRDHFDMQLLAEAEKNHLPVLGICRGAQLINVAHGGSLYQDLSYREVETLKHMQGHTPDLPTQTIDIKKDSALAKVFNLAPTASINSFHHQLIKRVGDGLTAVAWAKDGVVEAFENRDGSVIGVQWHPENLFAKDKTMNNLFVNLIKQTWKEGAVND